MTLPVIDENIHSVQITGNFDNWSRSLPTIKTTKEYLQQIKLDSKQDVVFKFIINDDQWIVNDQFQIVHDEQGNSNNIIYAHELIEETDDDEEPTTAGVAIATDKKKDVPTTTTTEEHEETPKEIVAEEVKNTNGEPDDLDLPKDTVMVVEEHESFVDPEVSSKSPSKSVITEDDIISDFDTSVQAHASGEELPKPVSNQQPLTQVLTSTSSFAAISSPPSSSDYEKLEKYEDDDETEYNTAANSGITTKDTKENPLVADYQENKPVKPVLLSHVSESTLEGSATETTGSNAPKIPGHYPSSPEHKSSSTTSLSGSANNIQKESEYTGKRESLISRFKSFFR
ncbi:CRP1 Cruciform DNA-recognizing protein 1 [Candida maltosa Xu316]